MPTSVILRRGRAAKAARGGFAYGSPAFGHRAAGRALVPDDREQAAIARARELQAAGASLRQIGAALEAEGHPSKRGDRWHPTAVARMLRRPADRPGGAAGDLTAPRQPRMGLAGLLSSAGRRTFVVDGAASRPVGTTWARASGGWSRRGVAPPGPPQSSTRPTDRR
jgi:Recombinase